MNIETVELISGILTINLLFHAALIGTVGLFTYHKLTRFTESLLSPNGTKKSA
jgi:hypothetical protein